jgi:glutamine amidotransferase
MIAVIDYGAGNLFSVSNALDFIGCENKVTSDPVELKSADKLILPGVGAFPDAMFMLESSGLRKSIEEEVQSGKPLLGICLGMQILFEKGFEYVETEGLGFIDGYVDKIEAGDLKVPHMGWSDLKIENPSPMSMGVDNNDMVYFVHSYKAVTRRENICLSTQYGQLIPALVRRENVYGCQFHPEKSGDVGLKILRNYVELTS